MKAMQVSLTHFQDQVKRFQSEYDEIQTEFSSMHANYFTECRKSLKEEERQQKVSSMMQGVEGAAATVGANQPGPYKGHSVWVLCF